MRDELYYFSFDPMRFPLNVEVCGYTVDDSISPHNESRKNCYMYLCEYIISGSGFLTCDGRKFTPSEGDVYILPKGSNHSYYPNPEHPWKKIWFIFDGPLVPNLLNGFRLQNDILFSGFYHENFFQELIELAKSGIELEEFNYKFSMKFFELLFLLSKHKCSQRTVDIAEKVQSYLDANIYEKLDLDAVADKFFLSKAHIINRFKEKFGITPYKYFMNQKISLAADFLANSKYSVNDISQMLSFGDHQYFCRVFKKATGYSPIKFRKSSDNLSFIWAQERTAHKGFLNNWAVSDQPDEN